MRHVALDELARRKGNLCSALKKAKILAISDGGEDTVAIAMSPSMFAALTAALDDKETEGAHTQAGHGPAKPPFGESVSADELLDFLR